MRRTIFTLAAALLIALLSAHMAVGQTSEQRALRAVVLNSLEVMRQTSYIYAVQSELSSRYIDRAENANGTLMEYVIAGQVSADGDHAAQFVYTVRDIVNPEAGASLSIERIVVKDVIYLRFGDIVTSDASSVELGIAPGWWQSDELLAQLSTENADEIAAHVLVQNFAAFERFTDLPIDAVTIETITELEPETHDGVEMRVFDVEMDAPAYVVRQQPPPPAGGFQANVLVDAALLAQSDLRASHRLWIGAQDGYLYRAESETFAFYPYSEIEFGSLPDIDVEIASTSTITFAAHGDEVIISTPEAVNSAG